MSFFDALILGLVQGLTEFIPVSSSGHLILARAFFLSPGAEDLAIDAILQLATSVAIAVYFFKDIQTLFRDKVYVKAVILGTVPAVILGLFLESAMETVFRSPLLVAVTLVAGALLMFYAEKISTGDKLLTPQKGLLIGLFQSLALIPGMSRSGSTISGGLLLGLERTQAVRFSFLLALPILLGSGMKKVWDVYQGGVMTDASGALLFGMLVAFFSGLLAIHILVSYLKSHKLTPFIWYRVVLAALIIIFL